MTFLTTMPTQALRRATPASLMKFPAWIQGLALGAIIVLLASAALAQPYPNRAVRLLVPFPPGSGSDVAARSIAQQLSARLGQPFVVENKPGAGGSIAALEVVRAAPDGYTLLVGSSSALAAHVSLLKDMPYDPSKDLAPVAAVKARLALFGLAPMAKSPEQLRAFIAAEIPKWARLAREAHIQPE